MKCKVCGDPVVSGAKSLIEGVCISCVRGYLSDGDDHAAEVTKPLREAVNKKVVKKTSSNSVTWTTKVSKEVDEKLRAIADEQGVSASNLLRDILIDYVK